MKGENGRLMEEKHKLIIMKGEYRRLKEEKEKNHGEWKEDGRGVEGG